ncbi:MAG: RecQ family zinc-binding domain-containing protein, partial [Carnobacterium sp.]
IEQAKSQVLGRKLQKERQLEYMMQYCQTTGCKRTFLLHYFNETLIEKPVYCCSSCGFDETFYELVREKETFTHLHEQKNWQEKIKKLILLQN